MPKERLYIADSDGEPSPATPAQRAYFRWQYAVGSFGYAEAHGSRDEARALLQEATELYDTYKTLRDGGQVRAPIPTGDSPHDAPAPPFVAERPAIAHYEYATRTGRGGRIHSLDNELLQNYESYTALRDRAPIAYDIIAGGAPGLDEPTNPRERPPLRPNELPPELAAFLKDKDYACLMQATDQGTVFVAKAPARDIQSLRGNVPVEITHELYEHPQAPVIRTVIRWYDQAQHPLAMEAFTNVGDAQQRADFLDLARREEVRFLFYDRALRHRLTKAVRNDEAGSIVAITETADHIRAAIPDEWFDFDAAKAVVMEVTSL